MSKELEMSFQFIADCKNEDGIELYMKSMESYFENVTRSLIGAGVIGTPEVEFIWEVRNVEEENDDPNYEPDYDAEDVLEVAKADYQKIDKLVAETRASVRTPLLKHDPKTQGLYNGMEQILAIMDGREPDLVDSDGNLRSKGGKVK